MFLIRMFFDSDLVSDDIDDSNHFFYYRSTNKYKKFIRTLKIVFISGIIACTLVIIGICLSTSIFNEVKSIIKDYLDLCTIVTAMASIFLTILFGFIVNADFYLKTIPEKEYEDRKKFNLVKILVNMAIKASEVITLANAKNGCSVFDTKLMKCIPKLDKCEEIYADPVKEFIDMNTGEDVSCQLIKNIHHEYLIMKDNITDYYRYSLIHFPELSEFFKPLYQFNISCQYQLTMYNFYTFFKLLIEIPDALVNKYDKDKKFINEINKLFKREYDKYKNKNITNSWSKPGFFLGLSLNTDTVFKPFNQFIINNNESQ